MYKSKQISNHQLPFVMFPLHLSMSKNNDKEEEGVEGAAVDMSVMPFKKPTHPPLIVMPKTLSNLNNKIYVYRYIHICTCMCSHLCISKLLFNVDNEFHVCSP